MLTTREIVEENKDYRNEGQKLRTKDISDTSSLQHLGVLDDDNNVLKPLPKLVTPRSSGNGFEVQEVCWVDENKGM